MRAFTQLHPVVCLIFFLEVLVLTMVQMHPLLLLVSCVLSLLSICSLKGTKAFSDLKASVALALLIVVGNGFLNPNGCTVLFTYLGGRTYTLESLLWGSSAALLFLAVLLWFQCFHVVMTQEKILFLFGHGIPDLSLVFCMVLRFVPEFTRKLRSLTQARCCLGLGTEQCKNNRARLFCAMEQLSAFLSLVLEQSVISAGSMRGRGYGLTGRTSYITFRMNVENFALLAVMLLMGGVIFTALALGGGQAIYFPQVQLAGGRLVWLSIGCETLLMLLPTLYHVMAKVSRR